MKSRLNGSKRSKPTFDELFAEFQKECVPLDPSLPGRQAIPTYLRSLDRQWRGGWFWQWPLLIAGPEEAGKSLFLAQLVASSLLSCGKPWRVLYFDFKGDYKSQRLLRVLQMRTHSSSPTTYLDRVNKNSEFTSDSLSYSTMAMVKQTKLATLVLDGWDIHFSSVDGLGGLAQVASKKQMGLVISMRGELNKILDTMPWEVIPYLMYITKLKHKQHRIRVWQNSRNMQIYDRIVKFKGYFVEGRSKSTNKTSADACTAPSHRSRD